MLFARAHQEPSKSAYPEHVLAYGATSQGTARQKRDMPHTMQVAFKAGQAEDPKQERVLGITQDVVVPRQKHYMVAVAGITPLRVTTDGKKYKAGEPVGNPAETGKCIGYALDKERWDACHNSWVVDVHIAHHYQNQAVTDYLASGGTSTPPPPPSTNTISDDLLAIAEDWNSSDTRTNFFTAHLASKEPKLDEKFLKFSSKLNSFKPIFEELQAKKDSGDAEGTAAKASFDKLKAQCETCAELLGLSLMITAGHKTILPPTILHEIGSEFFVNDSNETLLGFKFLITSDPVPASNRATTCCRVLGEYFPLTAEVTKQMIKRDKFVDKMTYLQGILESEPTLIKSFRESDESIFNNAKVWISVPLKCYQRQLTLDTTTNWEKYWENESSYTDQCFEFFAETGAATTLEDLEPYLGWFKKGIGEGLAEEPDFTKEATETMKQKELVGAMVWNVLRKKGSYFLETRSLILLGHAWLNNKETTVSQADKLQVDLTSLMKGDNPETAMITITETNQPRSEFFTQPKGPFLGRGALEALFRLKDSLKEADYPDLFKGKDADTVTPKVFENATAAAMKKPSGGRSRKRVRRVRAEDHTL